MHGGVRLAFLDGLLGCTRTLVASRCITSGVMVMSQSWKLARATEADVAKVRELTWQEYGPDSLAHPDYWRWLTRDNPAGPASAWVAKAHNQVIGALMMVPVCAKVGNRQVLSYLSMNALVRPDFRRQGVASTLGPWAVQDIARKGAAFKFCAPGPDAMGAWRKSDYEVVGPASPLMLKPLDVRAMLAYRGIKNRFVHWLAGAGHKLISPFLRRRWFKRSDPDLTISEVTSFDERFDRFWERVKSKYHTLVVRDAAFLQWRYKDVPLKSAHCWTATDHQGEIVAYIAFRSADLGGIPTGMVLDLLIEPSERGRGAGNQLVAQAIHQFKRERLALGVCIMFEHTDENKALRDQGYIPCPRSLEPHPFTLTCQSFTDQVSRSDLMSKDRWFLTLGDLGIDAFSA
jgi:predicted N-acetyltransferase YhbS